MMLKEGFGARSEPVGGRVWRQIGTSRSIGLRKTEIPYSGPDPGPAKILFSVFFDISPLTWIFRTLLYFWIDGNLVLTMPIDRKLKGDFVGQILRSVAQGE